MREVTLKLPNTRTRKHFGGHETEMLIGKFKILELHCALSQSKIQLEELKIQALYS